MRRWEGRDDVKIFSSYIPQFIITKIHIHGESVLIVRLIIELFRGAQLDSVFFNGKFQKCEMRTYVVYPILKVNSQICVMANNINSLLFLHL